MADTTKTDTTKPAAEAPKPTAAIPAAGTNATGTDTNLNNSPSPRGDGVQSAASEKQAAEVEKPSQASQQRINAAERAEEGAAGTAEVGDGPSGIVQSPGIVHAVGNTTVLEAATVAAEEAEKVEQLVEQGNLPQTTLDEIEAGRNALKSSRNRLSAEMGRSTAPTNPVDATTRQQQIDKA